MLNKDHNTFSCKMPWHLKVHLKMSKVIEFIHWKWNVHIFCCQTRRRKNSIVKTVLLLKQKKGGKNLVGIGEIVDKQCFSPHTKNMMDELHFI